MNTAFTIPVAFLVEGTDEHDAARKLTELLVKATLTQDHRARAYRLDEPAVTGVPLDENVVRDLMGPVESWWMPNHPDHETGGCGDIEQVLVFAPGTTATPVTQADADEAVTYWRGVIDARGESR